MGRYAFFNTGFEYKFGFGSQPSSDILIFGGQLCEGCDLEAGMTEVERTITWSAEDIPKILVKLHRFAENWYFELPNFSDYSRDYGGTSKLYSYLHDHCKTREHETIRLGCIIYHQLLYKCPLEAHWEN